MAALCPIMQYHSEFTGNLADADGRRPQRDRTPWNVAEQRGDQRALTLYRRFAVLRERLQPYLRAQADVCVDERVPMMRPLGLGWPTDRAVWEHPLQYQFGDSMLVAPVCDEGATGVDVYLPEGAWIDAWSGEERRGPRLVAPPRALGRDRGLPHRRRRGVPPPALPRPPRPPPPGPEDFHKQNRADLHDFAPQNRDGGADRDAVDPHRQQAAHPGDQPGDSCSTPCAPTVRCRGPTSPARPASACPPSRGSRPS